MVSRDDTGDNGEHCEPKCVVCGDSVSENKIFCDKLSCRVTYETIIRPLEIMEDKFASEQNWDTFFRDFANLPSPAQAYLLVEDDLPADIYFNALLLVPSHDLWGLLTGRTEFRRKFLEMLSPRVAEAAVAEIEEMKSLVKDLRIDISSVVPQMQALISSLAETVLAQNDSSETVDDE
ncbi:MAG TPA: hypothetical protein VJ044_13855 [Candidatus Hodarchaeales archaeon]|nr:hypothetical protein [Candidatus Hodarchaeales archaeon]